MILLVWYLLFCILLSLPTSRVRQRNMSPGQTHHSGPFIIHQTGNQQLYALLASEFQLRLPHILATGLLIRHRWT